MSDVDPAENETAERRKAQFASTFDALIVSNLQLAKTVQLAVKVITACAVLSLFWTGFTMYSMRGSLTEIRVMLQTALDLLSRR